MEKHDPPTPVFTTRWTAGCRWAAIPSGPWSELRSVVKSKILVSRKMTPISNIAILVFGGEFLTDVRFRIYLLLYNNSSFPLKQREAETL